MFTSLLLLLSIQFFVVKSLFVPPQKFPDIPGVYNKNGTINKEKVAIVNSILFNYTTWVKDTKIIVANIKNNPITNKDSITILETNLYNMAMAKSITINKPWRYHFVSFMHSIVNVLSNTNGLLYKYNNQTVIKTTVQMWLANIYIAVLKNPNRDLTTKLYGNNVDLQTIFSAYKTSKLLNNKAILDICLNFFKRQVTYGMITSGQFMHMPLSDISRGTRTMSYTYSSLTWLINLYNNLIKDFPLDYVLKTKKNNLVYMVVFYNKDYINKGLLFQNKTGVKQEIFVNPLLKFV